MRRAAPGEKKRTRSRSRRSFPYELCKQTKQLKIVHLLLLLSAAPEKSFLVFLSSDIFVALSLYYDDDITVEKHIKLSTLGKRESRRREDGQKKVFLIYHKNTEAEIESLVFGLTRRCCYSVGDKVGEIGNEKSPGKRRRRKSLEKMIARDEEKYEKIVPFIPIYN